MKFNFAPAIPFVAAAALLVLSSLFSISESAFLSMNKIRLRIRRRAGDKRAARASRLLARKDLLLNTLLAANSLVNILLSSIIAAEAMKRFGGGAAGVSALVSTILLLVFGEITPKTFATKNPDAIAYALSGFVEVIVAIFKPAALAFTFIARIFLAMFGLREEKRSQSYTEEDIKTFIDEGAKDGALEKIENTMMSRVFKFTDLEAQDIMIPRAKVEFVSVGASLREILEKSQRLRLSRFPVCRDDIDDIVGVIYLKDLLGWKNHPDEFDARKVARAPLFVLGTKKMSSLQQTLQENNQTLAIVVDEYSGTDGIVTQDDIMREIFGMADDSFDERGHTPLGKISNENYFALNGNTLLGEMRDALGVPIRSDINETLGGWMAEALDAVPQVNDTARCGDYEFKVVSMKGRRVELLQARRIETEGANDD